MNDYDLLGLMDTHKQMKAQGIDVPSTFAEFLTGIQPIDDGENIEVPQIGQGSGSYEGAIEDVKAREKTADFVTNQLGIGESRTGLTHLDKFIPWSKKPTKSHQEAIDHGRRLKTRQEIGYD